MFRRRLLYRVLLTALAISSGAVLVMTGCEPPPPPEGRRVGDTCPEITGTDVNGKEIRLTDYRGKVVLVSFWGTWCAPCRAMLPHERSKVQSDFAGRPFVILGVANDSPEDLREFLSHNYLPWSNIADGKPGAISRDWKVTRFPSAMLIDHAGIIRAIWFESMDYDEVWQMVEKTVRAAQG